MKKTKLDPSSRQQALEKLMSRCVLCGANQSALLAAIVNESNQAELVHIRCSNCKGALVALIYASGTVVTSIGMVTDLTQEDIAKFQQGKNITENDILNIHQTLQEADLCNRILQNY